MPLARSCGERYSAPVANPDPSRLLAEARKVLLWARSIMVLTGAGVSAESGVPTFRDAQTGLWSHFDPQRLASPEGFEADPGLVWRWYMSRLRGCEAARPNPGHAALAELERRSPELILYTQNVDDLHERAGSRRVEHLHGSIARFRCHGCGRPHALKEEEREAAEPPRCSCGSCVRPDVVWFGEMLPAGILERAWADAQRCDLMLVAGTSGIVQPAAQFPAVARASGRVVIDVNPERGPISDLADLHLQGPSGEILPQLLL
jgi:NAD-dependent deacetylase